MRPIKSRTCFNKKDNKPLSEYSSEHDAREGAEYARRQYGPDMSPYQCSKCGKWHLSPKERQTPSKVCSYCTDADGNPKELYATEEAARTRAAIIEKERSIKLNVYKCEYQNGWHLTKNIM